LGREITFLAQVDGLSSCETHRIAPDNELIDRANISSNDKHAATK
jgi:hypothetical protein